MVKKKSKYIQFHLEIVTPTYECSILDCCKTGTRLISSLKEGYELKEGFSGKVCEGHYRKDLRKSQKMNSQEILSEEEEEEEELTQCHKKFKLFCDFVLKYEDESLENSSVY